MNIQFVCAGNLFRSRLAEAYLRSKQLPNVHISSSGNYATTQGKGTVAWVTQRLLLRHGLIPYATEAWTQTDKKKLNNADLVIFFGKNNYEYCSDNYLKTKKYEIWELRDFDDKELNGKPLDLEKESEYISISEKTFDSIKQKVDQMIVTYNLDGK